MKLQLKYWRGPHGYKPVLVSEPRRKFVTMILNDGGVRAIDVPAKELEHTHDIVGTTAREARRGFLQIGRAKGISKKARKILQGATL